MDAAQGILGIERDGFRVPYDKDGAPRGKIGLESGEELTEFVVSLRRSEAVEVNVEIGRLPRLASASDGEQDTEDNAACDDDIVPVEIFEKSVCHAVEHGAECRNGWLDVDREAPRTIEDFIAGEIRATVNRAGLACFNRSREYGVAVGILESDKRVLPPIVPKALIVA